MYKRILIFDTDTLCHENLSAFAGIHDAYCSIESVASSFFFSLSHKGPWDHTLVNFNTEYFFGKDGVDPAQFAADIRNTAAYKVPIVGIAGNERQQTMLEQLGIPVMFKGYVGIQFRTKLDVMLKSKCSNTIEDIERVVSEKLEVPIELMYDPKALKRDIVEARQITMYLAKHYTSNTWKVIGGHFGKGDHAKAYHSCKVVQNLIDTDPKFKMKVFMIEEVLAFAS